MSNDHMSSKNETKDESDTNDSNIEENICDTTQETKEATSEKEEDLNGTLLAEGKIIQNTSEDEEVGENNPLISKETRIQNASEAEGGKNIPKLSKETHIQNASDAEEGGGENIHKLPKETDIKQASDRSSSAPISEDAKNDTPKKSVKEMKDYFDFISKGTPQKGSIEVDHQSEISGKKKTANPLDLSLQWKICTGLVIFVPVAVLVVLLLVSSNEECNNQMSYNLTNCENTKENEPFFQFPLPAEENNNVYVKYYMPCTGSYRLVSQLKTNITRICKKLETAYHYRLECKPVDGKQCTVECLKECMTFLITVPKIDILILEMDESCIRKGGYINLWKSQEQ